MFYPAEPEDSERFDRSGAQGRPARRRRRAEGRDRAARRASSIPARSRRPPSVPGRGAPSRRAAIVIVGPAHRVAFRGLAIHPAAKWRTPLGEAQVARDLARRSSPGRRAVFVDRAAVRRRAFARNASRDAAGDAAGAVRDRSHPRRRRRSACGRRALRAVWGGPETVIAVSSDLSHFLDRESAPKRSTPTPPGGSRRSTPQSLDGRRACGFLPIKGALEVAAERDMRDQRPASGDLGRRRRGRVARRRLRRLRFRIFRLGAARRGRSRTSALGLHGRA